MIKPLATLLKAIYLDDVKFISIDREKLDLMVPYILYL